MKVLTIGAGNMGLCIASNISLKAGFDSYVYTKKVFNVDDLVFINEKNEEFRNLDVKVEPDLQAAVKDADYILVTYPAFLRPAFLQEIEEYVEPGMRIGFIPGYGGAEYASKKLIDKGAIIFGLQRVPYVARQENHKIARALSLKDRLYIASIPKKYTESICSDFETFFEIPVQPMKEYLAVTLAPSNPLLHLTGLYSIFKNYHEGDYFDHPLSFYKQWTDVTSEMLFKYDNELQEICRKLKPLDMSEVVSLKEYYESPTPTALTRKLQSIKAFEVVQVPLKEVDGKSYPDYSSRMFVEDFPYGIAIIKYFGLLTGTDTPTIDTILSYYKEKRGIEYYDENGKPGKNFKDTGAPANYGLDSLEQIIQFYMI